LQLPRSGRSMRAFTRLYETMAITHRTKTSRGRNRASITASTPTLTLGPVNEWFELRRSRIQGVGAFALQGIPKGTRVIEYTGEKITNAEADRRYDDESRMRRHHTFLFVLNLRTVIDAAHGGNESMYINHSCDPNCEAEIIRGRIWIEAIKNIPVGSELTYDYQYENDSDYTENDLRFYACRCGSDKCRGTIVKTRRRIR
jgi:SET domain-containing protein